MSKFEQEGTEITRNGKPVGESKGKDKGKSKKADLVFLVRLAGCCRNKGASDNAQSKVAQDKVAFTQESMDFVRWALLRDERMSGHDCQVALERMGLELSQPTKRTGTLQEGETVVVQAGVNTNPLNVEACEKFDQQAGVVQSVGRTTVVLFGQVRVEFSGTEPGKATGLNRHKPAASNVGKPMIEVIYLRDPNARVSEYSKEMVDQYIAQGLAAGESRSDIYYSGLFNAMAVGGKGFYFNISAQQRGLVNDQPYRAFNPQSGKVLYVGRLGKRPGGWKAELAQLDALKAV